MCNVATTECQQRTYGLERFLQRALEPLPAMIDSEKTVDESLRELTDWMVAETRRTFREIPLSLELYAVAARQEKVRSFLRDSFSASYRLLAQLVRQGIERGEFRPIENTEDIAVVAGALFEGLALLAAIDPPSVDWERHSTAAVDLLLRGLKV